MTLQEFDSELIKHGSSLYIKVLINIQMTTTAPTNRVISYFFIFDFYHNKAATEENDLFPESIIYLYPPKEDIKRQKILEIGEIITAIQFLKYDLFSATPKEFNYKRSLITTEHYGRHCAFLVLSKDRFTIEETNIHLNHILQLFNTIYGTFNHVQSKHTDILQMQHFLKQTLTPLVEHVFNENRSIRNLFSAIDYAPLKKNNQLCLLHVKHFLIHLQTKYKIQNGFFAYEKRILHSTFDAETTYYIQVILGLERILSKHQPSKISRVETKLRNGVSIIKIYIPRPPSLEPILNAVNATTIDDRSNHQISSTEPIRITSLKPSTISEQPSVISDGKSYLSNIRDDLPESSGDITDLDTDPTGDFSSFSKTETDSLASTTNRYIEEASPRNNTITNNSHNSKEESLTDDQKQSQRYAQSRTATTNREYQETFAPKSPPPVLTHDDSLDGVIFEEMTIDRDSDSCTDFAPEDLIILPPKEIRSSFQPVRRKTITNGSDIPDGGYTHTNDQPEGAEKWGDVPEKNDEVERDEFILYIQRNSRMIFAGIMEESLLNDEYLQKLWCLILTGMADLDRDIQTIPIAGETSKHNSDVKFQFNNSSHQVQYERHPNINNYFYKIPSSDSACMAFTAFKKMNEDPEGIRMVALSRGNNLISINHTLPDRITCFCRRFQEPR